jgi:hypothetical protein
LIFGNFECYLADSDGLCEQIGDERLDAKRQGKRRHLALGPELLVGAEAAQQLQGGDSPRHPRNVHLAAGGDEQPLVVVTPRQRRHGRLKYPKSKAILQHFDKNLKFHKLRCLDHFYT